DLLGAAAVAAHLEAEGRAVGGASAGDFDLAVDAVGEVEDATRVVGPIGARRARRGGAGDEREEGKDQPRRRAGPKGDAHDVSCGERPVPPREDDDAASVPRAAALAAADLLGKPRVAEALRCASRTTARGGRAMAPGAFRERAPCSLGCAHAGEAD